MFNSRLPPRPALSSLDPAVSALVNLIHRFSKSSAILLMRCPACQTEYPDNGSPCPGCAAATSTTKSRRVRRKPDGVPDEETIRSEAYRAEVKRLVLLCLIGVLPGLGLLLAPVVVVLAALVLRRGRTDPAFTMSRKGAWITLLVALVAAVFNWLGLGLIALSFSGGS